MMNDPEKGFKVDFEPIGRRTIAEPGGSLLDAAHASGVQIASLCGGSGLCESCIIRLREGQLSDLSLEERSAREEGWLGEDERLACQASPLSDVIVDIPPKSLTTSQRLQLEAKRGQVPLKPVTRAITLQIDPPLPELPEDLMKAVQVGLSTAGEGAVQVSSETLEDIASVHDETTGDLRVVLRGEKVVGFLHTGEAQLGIAIDVGTTKLAAYLVNLEDGETIAHAGTMNPQISYGEDVISRISYANKGEGQRKTLTRVLVEGLNAIIDEMCENLECQRESIVDAVVVGNTVMHHTLLSLPLRQLGVSPFSPAVEGSQTHLAHDLGLRLARGADVYLPPNIAGYVGADHTAVLLALGFADQQRGTLVVDIGTNTEISLYQQDSILSCSCASGPAFEGAHIRDGMRAAPGAIERVQPANGGIRWQTVESVRPVGICGSGILDAVASLRSLGWVDRSGRLNQEAAAPQYRHEEGICLVRAVESGHGDDIVITRKDIHEVQLAQGAIRAGIEVLMQEAGLEASELKRVYLAGAFGTYLDPASAIASGLLPPVDLQRIDQVGNAAGEGARQLLLSSDKRLEVNDILRGVAYIELTTHPSFTDLYMQHLYLE